MIGDNVQPRWQRRWADCSRESNNAQLQTLEERDAAALFRRAEPPRLPSAAVFAAIQRRVLASEPPVAPSRFLRVALAAVSLCLSLEVGVAVVRHAPALRHFALPDLIVRASAQPDPIAEPLRSPHALPALAPLPAAPTEVPVLDRPPRRHPMVARVVAPPVAVRESLPESPLSREAAALAPAVAALDQRQDPAAALRSLADYRTQFPRGTLAQTADALELHALLAKGDHRAALMRLNALDAQGFTEVADADELRVLRAELLAEAGASAAAGAAFARALAVPLAPSLRERALYGEASVLERQGKLADGRAAIAAYLREFPEGRFAAEARAQPAP